MTVAVPERLILASRSPRRQKLLGLLGIDFDVLPSDIHEHLDPSESPESAVTRLATEKAEPIAVKHPSSLVIGSDTIVVLDGAVLGKPDSAQHARAMLRSLSGRTHQVYTGVALVHRESGKSVSFAEKTDVRFGELGDAEIDDYLAGGSSFDKAGSYGIQDDRGALFVEGIHGDFYNVMGLPVFRLNRVLQDEFPAMLPLS